MKKTLIIMFLALCTSVAFAQDYIVVRDGTGFGTVQTMPADTGIRIEMGLVGKLTGAQLNDIVNHGAEIPLDMKKQVVEWSDYYTHIVTEEGFTKVAVLDGKRIKAVEKRGGTSSKKFTLLYFLGILCLAVLAYQATCLYRKTEQAKLIWWIPLVPFALLGSVTFAGIAGISAVVALLVYVTGSNFRPYPQVESATLAFSGMCMLISQVSMTFMI